MTKLNPIRRYESRLPFLSLSFALGIGVYVAGALSLSPGADLWRHVTLFLISFAFYLVSVAFLLASDGRSSFSRRLLFAALLWALLLRVALLFTSPSLSDDVFRYVWDGKVAAAGISPYAYPPSAPELSHLRNSIWDGVNHKAMPTPYPPLAEALFAITYRLAPDGVTAMQVVAVLFDLGVIVALLLLLRRAELASSRVLIYAWNPLVLVQYAHSGHFDAAMVLPLLAAIYLLSVGQRAASGAALAASVLVKLMPALVAPLFLPFLGVAGVASAVLVMVLGAAPIVSTPGLAGVISEASDARFNDSAGYLLVKLFGLVTADPESVARLATAIVLVATSLLTACYLWRTRATWDGLQRATYRVLGLYLLLNAVVEPWYLAWIVPFLCFSLATDGRGLPDLAPSWGWLLLSGLVMLTDLTYLPGMSGLAWFWVRALEYGPLYLLIGLWVLREGVQILPPRYRRPSLGSERQGG